MGWAQSNVAVAVGFALGVASGAFTASLLAPSPSPRRPQAARNVAEPKVVPLPRPDAAVARGPARPPGGEEPTAARPDTERVTVRFVLKPAEAELYVDGKLETARDLQLARGTQHKYSVGLRGYRPKSGRFVADRDLSLDVSLSRARARRTRPRPSPKPGPSEAPIDTQW